MGLLQPSIYYIMQVRENRKKYFDRAARLGAPGIPTAVGAHAKPPTTLPPQMDASGSTAATARQWRCGRWPAVHVARLLQNFALLQSDKTGAAAEFSERFMKLLLQYLRRRPNDQIGDGAGLPNQEVVQQEEEPQIKIEQNTDNGNEGEGSPTTAAKTQDRPQCFFCRKFYCHRQSLTKHYKDIHIPNGRFIEPFQCPECLLQGTQNSWISASPSAWSNHIETFHGKINAPNLPSHRYSVEQQSRCLICNKWFRQRRGLTRHFRFTHIQKENRFKRPFQCPECRRQDQQDTWINGLSEWYDHASSAHSEIEGEPQQVSCGRKRKRGETNDEMGLIDGGIQTLSGDVRRSRRITSSPSRVEWNDSETSTLVDEDTGTPGRLIRVSSAL
jgi:Zn ribbon nucleic-acid-binding protein